MIKAVTTRRSVRSSLGARFGATAVVSVALTIAATAAHAADPGASSAGLLKFNNVTVVAAPSTSATLPSMNAGMRAFVDPSTGQMRNPSPEEMQTMASASSAPSMNRQQWYGAKGGIGVTLDDSFLQYAAVVRQPDGSLAEYCVTGIDEANELVGRTPVSHVAPSNGGRDER